MEARRAAGIIIYERKGQAFLMGLRADGQGWGFAAGKQEENDSNLMDTALRELKEELGVNCRSICVKKYAFIKLFYVNISELTKKLILPANIPFSATFFI